MVATFQRSVTAQPAPAVEGDFASANPIRSMVAGVGALVAGPLGVTIGKFAFADNDNGVVTSMAPGGGFRVGFVHRDQIAFIQAWLGSDTMLVPAGLEITLFDAGDFWCRFAAGAAIDDTVYASLADGSASVAAADAAATASFATNVMTVTVPGGYIAPGAPVTSAGVAAGTKVVAQLTGTPGGAGTYQLSTSPGTIASQAATIGLNMDTGFKVSQAALAGELAKISRH